VARESGTLARDLEARETQPAQGQDDRDLRRRSLARTAQRSRRAIAQTPRPFGSETGQPLAHAALGETALEGGRSDTELLGKDGAHDSFSTPRRQARIVMELHVRVGFDGLDVFTPTTLANPSPHEQPIETSQLEQR
jgi:hypothetical protein